MKRMRLVSIVYAVSLMCVTAVLISNFMSKGIQWGGICITFFIICFGTWGYCTLRSKYMKEKDSDC